MIQVNELRIGNWVNFVYTHAKKQMSRPCKVISINERSVVVIDKGVSLVSDFEPIPLTPEILEKCGFAKHPNSNKFWNHCVLSNGWHISEALHTQEEAGVTNGFLYWGEEFIECRYLHQLQNLYFALTGDELKFNPSSPS